jgi:hypothetical protein
VNLVNIHYEKQKEEALQRLYKLGDKDEIDKAFEEIFEEKNIEFKVVSFMNDLIRCYMSGWDLSSEEILEYWKGYRKTIQCNCDALSMAMRNFGQEAITSTAAFELLEKKLLESMSWWRKLWYRVKQLFNSR